MNPMRNRASGWFLAICLASSPGYADSPSSTTREIVEVWDVYKETLQREIDKNDKAIESARESTAQRARDAREKMERSAAEVMKSSVEGIAKDLRGNKPDAISHALDATLSFKELAEQTSELIKAETDLALDDHPQVKELQEKNRELRKNLALAEQYVNMILAAQQNLQKQQEQAADLSKDSAQNAQQAKAVGDQRERTRAEAARRERQERQEREARETRESHGEPRGGDREREPRSEPKSEPRSEPKSEPREPPDRSNDGPEIIRG